MLFNRTLPDAWIDAAARRPDGNGRTAAILDNNLARWAEEARRQADARTEFAAGYGVPLAALPWLAAAPTDLSGLAELLDGASGIPLDLLGPAPSG